MPGRAYLPNILANINVDALVLGAIALAIGILWPRFLQSLLPAPLAALIIGMIFGVVVFPGAPGIGTVPTGLLTLQIPSFPFSDLVNILQPALILALLGSIGSFLTLLVADSITRTRHKSNRELIGQGLGNMASGLISGLPGAGAAMRTVVNVRAGGRSRLSGLIHAVLAGILLKIGWDIIDWGYIRRARRASKNKMFVMLVTLVLTAFVDLIATVA